MPEAPKASSAAGTRAHRPNAASRQLASFDCSLPQNGSRIAPMPSSSHSQFLAGCASKQSKSPSISVTQTCAAAMDAQRGRHWRPFLQPSGLEMRHSFSHIPVARSGYVLTAASPRSDSAAGLASNLTFCAMGATFGVAGGRTTSVFALGRFGSSLQPIPQTHAKATEKAANSKRTSMLLHELSRSLATCIWMDNSCGISEGRFLDSPTGHR